MNDMEFYFYPDEVVVNSAAKPWGLYDSSVSAQEPVSRAST